MEDGRGSSGRITGETAAASVHVPKAVQLTPRTPAGSSTAPTSSGTPAEATRFSATSTPATHPSSSAGTAVTGTQPPAPSTPAGHTPVEAALARVLKVGDRVRMSRTSFWKSCRPLEFSRHWRYDEFRLLSLESLFAGAELPYDPGKGTVVAVPSQLAADKGKDPQGLVDVRWDRGGEWCLCMGYENAYDVELV